jgi:phosphoribosylformylglycinamidine synthase
VSRFRLEVLVTPRPGLLDPQGKAVHHALNSLGWTEVEEVRVGKAIHLDVDAASEAEARDKVEAMCRKLLANPVTEDYEVSVVGSREGAPS